MAQFVAVPPERVEAASLQGLLEECASRDGTDYGEHEFTLADKVAQLLEQLRRGELKILYDLDSQQWDLLPREEADLILHP